MMLTFKTIAVLGLRNTLTASGRPTKDIYNNYDHVLNCLTTFKVEKIYSGGAQGVQSLVERYAREMDIAYETIKPVFTAEKSVTKDEKESTDPNVMSRDFFLRDIRLISMADALILFWDGNDSGYRDAERHCLSAIKKPCFSFPVI